MCIEYWLSLDESYPPDSFLPPPAHELELPARTPLHVCFNRRKIDDLLPEPKKYIKTGRYSSQCGTAPGKMFSLSLGLELSLRGFPDAALPHHHVGLWNRTSISGHSQRSSSNSLFLHSNFLQARSFCLSELLYCIKLGTGPKKKTKNASDHHLASSAH